MKKIFMTLALGLLSTSVLADKTFEINPAKSTINWTGKKVSGQHVGTINLKDGTIVLDDKGVLKSAKFTADMTSIVTTDLEGEWKTKLEGHLKNDDFFAVDKHPTSTLSLSKIISVKGSVYDVEANLTIKGTTKPVKFKVDLTDVKNPVLKGDLTFNRTHYDIKYGSGAFFEGLGDKMIYDDVELKYSVSTK